MRPRTKTQFEIENITFEVKALWNWGYPDTREEPGEPGGWEIEHISIPALGDQNLINLVSDYVVSEAEYALDNQASADEDADMAAREEYEERRRERA